MPDSYADTQIEKTTAVDPAIPLPDRQDRDTPADDPVAKKPAGDPVAKEPADDPVAKKPANEVVEPSGSVEVREGQRTGEEQAATNRELDPPA